MDKSGFPDNDIHSRGEIQLRKGATEGRGDNPKRRAFEENLPNIQIQAYALCYNFGCIFIAIL